MKLTHELYNLYVDKSVSALYGARVAISPARNELIFICMAWNVDHAPVFNLIDRLDRHIGWDTRRRELHPLSNGYAARASL